MPILDSDSDLLQKAEKNIKEEALKDFFYASLLAGAVSMIETDIYPAWKKIVQTWHEDEGSTMFVSELVKMLEKKDTLNPMFKRHLGRPVYTLDCRYLHKGDAIGWLEKVAQFPKSPKPILVIENITEIPEEDANHDDPQYVRNLLLHSWKNPKNDLFNAHSRNSFRIVPIDYKVFITWTPENREKLKTIHHPSDGFAWIGNLEEYRQDFDKSHMDSTIEELKKDRIIWVEN